MLRDHRLREARDFGLSVVRGKRGVFTVRVCDEEE